MKIFVDFHCHTSASKDSNTSIEQLFQYGRRRGLNRIVITDHNTISGAKKAFSLDPGFFIIGEEIMTTKGEILAVYLQEEIPSGKDMQINQRNIHMIAQLHHTTGSRQELGIM